MTCTSRSTRRQSSGRVSPQSFATCIDDLSYFYRSLQQVSLERTILLGTPTGTLPYWSEAQWCRSTCRWCQLRRCEHRCQRHPLSWLLPERARRPPALPLNKKSVNVSLRHRLKASGSMKRGLQGVVPERRQTVCLATNPSRSTVSATAGRKVCCWQTR